MKEIISDLFSQTILMLEQNTVSYLKALRRAIVKKKPCFFCTNVEELIHRADLIRMTESVLNRWGCDHGQELLKLVVQPTHRLTFLDSVKGSMLVAVSDAPETPFNLNQIFQLIPEMNLETQQILLHLT